MPSFLNVFGGGVPPSELRYAAYSISANAELVWPENYTGTDLLAASILELTATAPGLTLTLPAADARSVGEDFIIRNPGAQDVEILDQAAGSLTTLPAGEIKAFYIKDNADPAGDWGIFDYGAGTSSADASALAGPGLRVWTGKLAPDHSYITKNANYTVVTDDRNKLINVVTGTVVITMPPAATAEAGFHVLIRNSSLGTITVEGDGAEPVDGGLNKDLFPDESAIFVSDGAGWYTVGYGRDAEFVFSEFVVNAAAGDVALSSADVSGRMIRVSGTAVANIEVTLPAIDNIYFVNVESGMGAFTATFTTGSGDTAVLSANDRTVLYSDGTNVQVALTTALATTLSLNDGSAASPSISFALDPNTGMYRVGADVTGFSSNGVNVLQVDVNGVAAAAGAVGTPGLSFFGDRDTGLYSIGANQLGIAAAGALVARFVANGLQVQNGSAANPSISFINDTDTGLYFTANALNVGVNTVQLASFTGSGIQTPTNGGIGVQYSFIGADSIGMFWAGPGTLGFTVQGDSTPVMYLDGTDVDLFKHLNFSAASLRITGDFSNAVASLRPLFQSNVTNGVTALGAIPNGTATTSSFQFRNNSDADNTAIGTFRCSTTSIDITSAAIGTGVLLPITFIMGGLSETMRIATDGDFEIARFTRMGELAPYTKKKKLTGTTNAAAGGTASVAHALTSSKIVGVQVVVGASAGTRVLPGSPIAANAYQVHYDGTNVVITNGASSGATINNQPFTVLLEYEE